MTETRDLKDIPLTEISMKVEVEDAKYTLVVLKGGVMHVFRYGKAWRDVTGDKFVFALASEVATARHRLELIENQDAVICLPCRSNHIFECARGGCGCPSC